MSQYDEWLKVPPNYVKSVTVTAPKTGVTYIQITATYTGKNVEDESISITLTQNGQSHTFPEMTEYYGYLEAVRPIHVIKGIIGEKEGKVFEIKPEEHCSGVVANLAFSLHHEPEHIKLIK